MFLFVPQLQGRAGLPFPASECCTPVFEGMLSGRPLSSRPPSVLQLLPYPVISWNVSFPCSVCP